MKIKNLILTAILLLSVGSLFGQAKKPIIMVIPNDAYCLRQGYVTTYTDANGKEVSVADYDKAFLNDEELRLAICELSNIMAQREFPLKDLEATLKKIKNEEIEASLFEGSAGGSIVESPLDKIKRTAKADIIMDLDFSIKKSGPRKYISFNLRGLDAYTSKVITAVSGDGRPSSSATIGLLIEEAVLNYMDSFNASLQNHFNDMFENGREVAISIKMTNNCPISLSDDVTFLDETVQLSDVLDYWMDENCIGGRFSRVNGGDNFIDYEQVRIPLFKTVLGKERAIDTRGFAQDLGRFLSNNFQIPYKIYERGLGNVWVVLGD